MVAGQQEVHTVVRKLRKLFPLKKNKYLKTKLVDIEKNEILKEVTNNEHSNDSDNDFDVKEVKCHNQQRKKKQIIFPTVNLDEYVYSYYNYSNRSYYFNIYLKNIYI